MVICPAHKYCPLKLECEHTTPHVRGDECDDACPKIDYSGLIQEYYCNTGCAHVAALRKLKLRQIEKNGYTEKSYNM